MNNSFTNPCMKLGGLLALLFALTTGTLRAQSPELPPEVRILAYTNGASSHREGTQDWFYPDGNRHGEGYIRDSSATRYHRYGGGQITTYYAYHSAEGGYGGGGWDYYTQNSSGTAWSGPCPATAYLTGFWTNSSWYEGMEMPSTDWNQSASTDTNFVWEPSEARAAASTQGVPWTLIFNSGPPHQGYFERWNSSTRVDTTLELYAGGATNSTEDVTFPTQLHRSTSEHLMQMDNSLRNSSPTETKSNTGMALPKNPFMNASCEGSRSWPMERSRKHLHFSLMLRRRRQVSTQPSMFSVKLKPILWTTDAMKNRIWFPQTGKKLTGRQRGLLRSRNGARN